MHLRVWVCEHAREREKEGGAKVPNMLVCVAYLRVHPYPKERDDETQLK